MANGIKTKISEIDEKVLNSGLVEIKGDYVELNFEGIYAKKFFNFHTYYFLFNHFSKKFDVIFT